jgi:Glycosyltransferase family 87
MPTGGVIVKPLTMLILAVIPITVFLLPPLLYPAVGPYSAATHIHPVYAYLFSSLQIAAGEAPQHIDHPGTPVQILGGAVIWLVAVASGAATATEAVVAAVLAEPERYLQFMNGALGALVAAALWILAWRLTAALGGLAYGLAGQLLLLASPSALLALHRFAAEGMLIAVSLLLGAALISMLASDATPERDPGSGPADAVLLGGLLGLGIATKLTVIPFGVLLLVPRRLGHKIAAIAAAGVALLIATIPIWSRFDAISSWISALALHSGRYGSGPRGLPALADTVKGAAEIALSEPGLALSAPVILAAVLVSRRRGEEPAAQRVLVCGLLAIAGQCLLALKNPEPRYVLPSAVLACALVPVALRLLLAGRTAAAMRWVLPGFALLTIGVAVRQTTSLVTERELERASYAMVMAEADKRGCFVVPFFRSDVPPFALFEGKPKGAFNAELTRMYPDVIAYEIFPTRIEANAAVRDLASIGFYRWDERLTLDAVERAAAGREVCLIGDRRPGMVAGRSVEQIDVAGAPETFHSQRLFVLGQL